MDRSGSHSRNKYYLVPHNVSAVFTGRDNVFQELLQNCISSQNLTIQLRYVLYGLGGSGKTQVSLKFAQDYRESFWGIFCIDCSTIQTIKQGFSQISQICQIEDDLQSIRNWLSNNTEQWLLIFDNADDPSINLFNYFLVGLRGTILITTRNPECRVHQTVGSYELAGMGTEDAIDLLLKSIEATDLSPSTLREKARTITKTLGNLSLAIVQAGAIIRQNLCPIEDYYGMYQCRRRELLSRAPTQASSDYKYTVYTTWEVSVNMIESMSSEVAIHALELLRLFSFLHFDSISEEIFQKAWVNKIEQARWVLKTAVLLADSISWENSISGYDFRRSLSSHIATCLQAMTLETLFTSDIGAEGCCNVANRFARVLEESGQWQGAMQLEEKVYEARKRTLGEEHPSTLLSMGNLARSYSDLGRGQDAVQLAEKVYEARKRTLGEEHPNTLSILEFYNIALYKLHEE
ncbi:Nephrocystin-3, partial [Lachnellula arida]